MDVHVETLCFGSRKSWKYPSHKLDMTSFAFNFLASSDETGKEKGTEITTVSNTLSGIIAPETSSFDTLSFAPVDTGVFGSLSHISNPDSGLQEQVEQLQSDLIPKMYEGGFKIWEGSLDLMRFLPSVIAENLLSNKSILELGCGHGLPGISAMIHGNTSHLTLQDYNREVIDCVSIPNAWKNLGATDHCTFLYGDWDALRLQGNLLNQGYDIVLAAETVYSVETTNAFLRTLEHCVKVGGLAIVSGKQYYFGVGGGMNDVVEYMRLHNARWKVGKVQQIVDGQSNVRSVCTFQRC